MVDCWVAQTAGYLVGRSVPTWADQMAAQTVGCWAARLAGYLVGRSAPTWADQTAAPMVVQKAPMTVGC